MQKLMIIAILFILTACGRSDFIPVEIGGKDTTNSLVIRGMWVLYQDILITGAHVVRNQQFKYFVWNQEYSLQHIDYTKDRAILTQKKSIPSDELYTLFTWASYDEPVYAQVMRNNKIVTLTGTVVDASGSVLGYNQSGRIMSLQWIILTNISFAPGDSGAPIFNLSWELIDLVHVQ